MSGRSAYVRKEKTKIKDEEPAPAPVNEGMAPPSILAEFPGPNGHPMHFDQESPCRYQGDLSTVKSTSSKTSDDLAYARVRKPQVPIIDVSGIEKSSFRSMMDKKSEGVRQTLARMGGKGKKKNLEDQRPPTAATIRADQFESDGGDYYIPVSGEPRVTKSRPQNVYQIPYQQNQPPDYMRPGPPSSKLPPIPQGPQLKRWVGGGRPAAPWNKLRKDPELWDPNGDTLVYFGHDMNSTSKSPPSFRLSSHVLEATESRFLITLLREGSTEESNTFNMPPSPVISPGMRPAYSVASMGGLGRHQPTPPMSEASMGYDGQISYEIYFPTPMNVSKTDILRHQITTRNVFAMLYQASLVGLNLFQTLSDLQERLEVYMPSDCDAAGMIIDYITTKGIDDAHENPSVAAAMLAWSETQVVRWEEGWREAYVHCAGMYNRMESTADFRFVTPITKALLERASLEVQVRVQSCEDRLSNFDFEDMWPMMTSQPPPARSSFERMRKFFAQFYLDAFGAWPPQPPAGEDQWLTRGLAQKMQKDFGALYDYLVNREVAWDCSEERSGRKWNIICTGNRSFDADTFDLPFTDLLVAFDNRHRYPHIPHPFPLVPESIPVKSSKENLFKSASKKTPKTEDKMAERRAALAYTESTNIYLLGSDFVNNDLIDAFVKFEKGDKAAEVDPFAARRGRWVLIYGILQTLASVSVDTPELRFTTDVSYHLNPRLRGTPPWKGANQNIDEASHVGSYCWTIRDTWRVEAPVMNNRRPDNPISRGASARGRSTVPSISDSETSTRPHFSPASSKTRAPRNNNRMTGYSDISATSAISSNSNNQFSSYGPGIEKLGEWPIREESRGSRVPKDFPIKEYSHKAFMHKSHSENDVAQQSMGEGLKIKDFDDYDF